MAFDFPPYCDPPREGEVPLLAPGSTSPDVRFRGTHLQAIVSGGKTKPPVGYKPNGFAV
jgi:hypothetical protein